jgi:hypothetical protein
LTLTKYVNTRHAGIEHNEAASFVQKNHPQKDRDQITAHRKIIRSLKKRTSIYIGQNFLLSTSHNQFQD